jgi:hypothetical protein
MLAIKIVCFSLQSVSLISIVSAAQDRNPQATIDRFLEITEAESDWNSAYEISHKVTLDSYFEDRVDDIERTVTPYLDSSTLRRKTARILPLRPDPTVNRALDGIRKLVFMIRYFNLRFLNRLLQYLRLTPPPPVLAMIDDEYVKNVSTQYDIVKRTPPKRSYEHLTIDVAVLSSMNQVMLARLRPTRQRSKLETYQNLINRLHNIMARFMQLTAERSYVDQVADLEYDIDQLQMWGIRGYARTEICSELQNLSHLIVSVIAIFGGSCYEGAGILSSALNDHQSVRRFLFVDSEPPEYLEGFCHWELMTSLASVIGEFEGRFQEYQWFSKLLPMVDQIISLGNPAPRNRTRSSISSRTVEDSNSGVIFEPGEDSEDGED